VFEVIKENISPQLHPKFILALTEDDSIDLHQFFPELLQLGLLTLIDKICNERMLNVHTFYKIKLITNCILNFHYRVFLLTSKFIFYLQEMTLCHI